MSNYLNKGTIDFKITLNGKIYVDKTLIISQLNSFILTPQRFICNCRPRRFGKSVTAEMLYAYYSKGCNSSELFDNLKIASDSSYKEHINRYDTIFINMTDEFNRASGDINKLKKQLTEKIVRELKIEYPEAILSDETDLSLTLSEFFSFSSVPFVIIIDEWDCIMREKKEDTKSLKEYLEWLKLLFKNKGYIALSYMTGILPIKKYGSQSALNMFTEVSVTNPLNFGEYIGFTESEVRDLCSKFEASFETMKQWYDGYSFDGAPHIYNPNSVVQALIFKTYQSYWTKTESFEALKAFVDYNISGLKDKIIKLIAGEDVAVDTGSFSNDMTTFNNEDDVLTLLLHLGYLAINKNSNLSVKEDGVFAVHIPNEEIKAEFRRIIKVSNNYNGVYSLISKTDSLLNNIWSLDSDEVAKAFDEIHQDHTSILTYNDENSLACVIELSLLLSTADTYSVVRELPTGKGFADLVYLPKQGINRPALLVELKYNKDAVSALNQIKEKNYLNFFKDYKGEILLVGINYDKQTKIHNCKIERIRK